MPSVIGVILTIAALFGGGAPSQAQLVESVGGEEVAWVTETQDDELIYLSYAFPVSLTPIELDGAATGGYGYRSFDSRTTFSYEDKASYFDTSMMNRENYLAEATCKVRLSPGHENGALSEPEPEEPKPQDLVCRDKPNAYLVIFQGAPVAGEGDNFPTFDSKTSCAEIFAIAPDRGGDASRFVVHLSLCSSKYSYNDVRMLGNAMLDSLVFEYRGGCKSNPNVIGCHSEGDSEQN